MNKAIEIKQLLERSPIFGFTQKVKVEQGMAYLYSKLGLTDPRVICFDSPFQLQVAIKQAQGKSIGLKVKNQSFEELDQFLRANKPGARINTKLWNEVGQNAARALKLAYADEKDLLQLHQRLRPVFAKVEQAVQHKLNADLRSSQVNVDLFAHHPHYFDFKWLLHYQDNLSEIPLGETLYQILEAGLMYCFNFENLVLWCPLPKVVNFNPENVDLHSEMEPSLAWNKHFTLYHWNGVPVPRKLIEAPDLVKRSDIMAIRNAEVRRCFQEVLGSERFATLFQLKEIDRDRDLQGNMQYLYRSKEMDQVAKEHLQFAEVTCPTTGRQYFLSVPPDLDNVWQAVAWTFGKTEEEYQPQQEF